MTGGGDAPGSPPADRPLPMETTASTVAAELPGPALGPGAFTLSRPAAGSPSVRTNCAATAAWCPAKAAAIPAPDAVSFGLGAGIASPAIHDSVNAIPVSLMPAPGTKVLPGPRRRHLAALWGGGRGLWCTHWGASAFGPEACAGPIWPAGWG